MNVGYFGDFFCRKLIRDFDFNDREFKLIVGGINGEKFLVWELER